jgi:hypothetical protein
MAEIRVLGKGDENVLMNVAADVFDNPIDPVLTAEFLADPRHHIADDHGAPDATLGYSFELG